MQLLQLQAAFFVILLLMTIGRICGAEPTVPSSGEVQGEPKGSSEKPKTPNNAAPTAPSSGEVPEEPKGSSEKPKTPNNSGQTAVKEIIPSNSDETKPKLNDAQHVTKKPTTKAPEEYTDAQKRELLDEWEGQVDEASNPGWAKRTFLQNSQRAAYYAKFKELIGKARAELKTPGSKHKDYFWNECLEHSKKLNRWWYNRKKAIYLGYIAAFGVGVYYHDPVMKLLRDLPTHGKTPAEFPFFNPVSQAEVVKSQEPITLKDDTAWIIAFIVCAVFLALVLMGAGLCFLKNIMRDYDNGDGASMATSKSASKGKRMAKTKSGHKGAAGRRQTSKTEAAVAKAEATKATSAKTEATTTKGATERTTTTTTTVATSAGQTRH